MDNYSEAPACFSQTLYGYLLTKGFKYDHNKKQSDSKVNQEVAFSFCFSLGNLTIKLKTEKYFPSNAKAMELNTKFRNFGTRTLSSSSSGQTGCALQVRFWFYFFFIVFNQTCTLSYCF